MSESMQVLALEDGHLRIVLEGRLDSATVDRIEPALQALLAGSNGHVLIDLYEVGFVASMAIRMFVATARMLQRSGRMMVLFGAQPLVREVFNHVALDDLIPIVPEAAEALDLIAGAPR